MTQSDLFISSEADAYTARNLEHNARYRITDDVVAQCLDEVIPAIKPGCIIDYGCSTGERLEALCGRYRCDGVGCDPSRIAIHVACSRAHPDIRWYIRALPCEVSQPVDLIVSSYVWHWIAREDLIDSMRAIDYQLVPGGHLVINDFHSVADVPYRHREGITTFKRHYPEMFVATGLYRVVHRVGYAYPGGDEPCDCAVLRKQ